MPAIQRFAFALGLALLTFTAAAQDDALHAPDGRAPRFIRPLYFGPKPNAPFTAIARTQWVQIMPDNSTITSSNARVVARDMDGRIFQERRTFVTNDTRDESHIRVVEYTDPLEHTYYSCNPHSKICFLNNYNSPEMTEGLTPVGLQPDGRSFLTRENLGTDTYEGLEVQCSRETLTYYKQTIGNTSTILRTVEYWYSPALGVNVKVVRHDPRDGDQTLWLTGIDLGALDPATFKVPDDYQVFDRRMTQPMLRGGQEAPQQ
jgi:hypothetical protein